MIMVNFLYITIFLGRLQQYKLYFGQSGCGTPMCVCVCGSCMCASLDLDLDSLDLDLHLAVV